MFYHHVSTPSYKTTITYAVLDFAATNVTEEIEQLLNKQQHAFYTSLQQS
jgi:hypothetical protein